MTDEEFAAYRESRYEKALAYYDTRARSNKRRYYLCAVYILAVSAAVGPSALLVKNYGHLIAVILSPTVTVVAAISGLFKFHENWLGFRSTWDLLKSELYLHDARVGSYQEAEDRNRMFVQRIESALSSESLEWLRRHASDRQGQASDVVGGH